MVLYSNIPAVLILSVRKLGPPASISSANILENFVFGNIKYGSATSPIKCDLIWLFDNSTEGERVS
ncbi:hypothetical protein Nepgr_022601 [Nepenthes gracilis]|uniref:Uncharacterized protein n=1 Tax=Nepenthes gracilis TaxID=150966 RepID=A0AAD3XY87_NEPGR|nr:hypothetical protein Nepgr_022601 [Nepenthes gracilis]